MLSVTFVFDGICAQRRIYLPLKWSWRCWNVEEGSLAILKVATCTSTHAKIRKSPDFCWVDLLDHCLGVSMKSVYPIRQLLSGLWQINSRDNVATCRQFCELPKLRLQLGTCRFLSFWQGDRKWSYLPNSQRQNKYLIRKCRLHSSRHYVNPGSYIKGQYRIFRVCNTQGW